jgi:hypothetical protein
MLLYPKNNAEATIPPTWHRDFRRFPFGRPGPIDGSSDHPSPALPLPQRVAVELELLEHRRDAGHLGATCRTPGRSGRSSASSRPLQRMHRPSGARSVPRDARTQEGRRREGRRRLCRGRLTRARADCRMHGTFAPFRRHGAGPGYGGCDRVRRTARGRHAGAAFHKCLVCDTIPPAWRSSSRRHSSTGSMASLTRSPWHESSPGFDGQSMARSETGNLSDADSRRCAFITALATGSTSHASRRERS